MFLNITQAIIAIALIALILIQERSSGLSGAFGGGEAGFTRQRRGLEKIIFNSTSVLLAAFIILSVLNFVL